MPTKKTFCIINNCDLPCVGRGLCRTHYMQWKRGKNLPMMPRKRDISSEQRFWNFVEKTDYCWIYNGHKFGGYGRFEIDYKQNRSISAHRYAYQLSGGNIPVGYQIDHLCRNKMCCNPDHLECVTPKENTRRHHFYKTHCKYGHSISHQKDRIRRNECRKCNKIRMKLRYKKSHDARVMAVGDEEESNP